MTDEARDAAMERLAAIPTALAELDELPVADHPERYDRLHAELTDGLAAVDDAARGGG